MKCTELVLVLSLVAFCLADNLTLSISDGQVRGTKKWTYAGSSYYAFYSIRYAKAPTGSLRFQAPAAVDPWTGVYDATKEGNICYQVNRDSADESEDCLSLSVYTPKNPSEPNQTKLPVLFYLHGGGFNWGSGQTKGSTGGIDPGYFMDSKSVIIVSINYRLGFFGFSSTGDTVIPGNAGLKDQRLALRWVQKNIANFGGDPTKVTIFGESAGGASVGYHILSTSSKGLFRGGILSSGTALCPWAYQRNQTEITFKTASFINSQFDSNRDSATLLSYLQSVDAKLIDTASKNYTDWAQSYSRTGLNGVRNGQLQQGFFYAPVVEVETPDAFLTEKPYQILESGNFNKVPILIGTCSDEGLINYNSFIQWTLSVYDQDHTLLVPQGMHIKDQATKMAAGTAIKFEYSAGGDLQKNIPAGIQYFSEQDFQKSLLRHAEIQSKYADVYFYKYSYFGKMSGAGPTYPGTSNVTHTSEMGYIWQRGSLSSYPQTDQIVHQRFMKIWTNFVAYQNPTPTKDAVLQNIIWPKLTENNLQYVDIRADLVASKDPIARYPFWKDLILTKYGVPPFETF